MNKRLKKKLAYWVASYSFNHEELSTLQMLREAGIVVTREQAEEITNIASEFFKKFRERAAGWEAAKK